MPTGDYYGGNRPGNTLFDESLVALDLKTGKRKWHYQTVHHGLWDYDLPCAPILFDMTIERPAHQGAGAADQAGVSVRPQPRNRRADLADRRAAGAAVHGSRARRPVRRSPSRPGRRRSIGRASAIDDLIDFTPALRAEALEVIKRYQIGPLFTPPVLSNARWSDSRPCRCRPTTAARTGRAARSIPRPTACTSIRTPTCHVSGIVPPPIRTVSDMGYVSGQARADGVGRRRGGRGRAGGATVQGLPLVKPPYDRITAYDMNTGDLIWQKPHSSTPDEIRNHPALKGLDLPRLGQPGRTFIGMLATKTLLIAGEGGVHTNEARAARRAAARLRQGAPAPTSAPSNMPAKQTGSPMTYMINGKQCIVVAVSGINGAELIAYTLP